MSSKGIKKLVNNVKRLKQFHQVHLWLDVFSFRTGYVIFNPFINPNIVYKHAVFWHSEHCFTKLNAYEPSFKLVTLRLLDFMASSYTNRWHMIEKFSTSLLCLRNWLKFIDRQPHCCVRLRTWQLIFIFSTPWLCSKNKDTVITLPAYHF